MGADTIYQQPRGHLAYLKLGAAADALAPALEAAEREKPGYTRFLHDLLQVEVDPRSPERGQYTFVQALIREVAYSTLALRDRRDRHVAAARHFESIGDEELAGAVAAHYSAAFQASSEGTEADELAELARSALIAAGTLSSRSNVAGTAPLAAFFFAGYHTSTLRSGRSSVVTPAA